MSTLRHLVSRVRSTHKLLSTDGSISDRAIAAELKSNNILLTKRETDKRKLWNSQSIFTVIPYVELEEVPLSQCCDIAFDKTISRSKYRIPKIAEGNFQSLIQGVYNVESSKKYTEVSINRYINLLKITFFKREIFYFLHDGYLHLTEPLKAVKLVAFFEEDIPDALLYGDDCDDCPRKRPEDECMNPLDKPYGYAGYLEAPIIQLTSQALLSTFFKLNDDKTQDNKDDQTSKV